MTFEPIPPHPGHFTNLPSHPSMAETSPRRWSCRLVPYQPPLTDVRVNAVLSLHVEALRNLWRSSWEGYVLLRLGCEQSLPSDPHYAHYQAACRLLRGLAQQSRDNYLRMHQTLYQQRTSHKRTREPEAPPPKLSADPELSSLTPASPPPLRSVKREP